MPTLQPSSRAVFARPSFVFPPQVPRRGPIAPGAAPRLDDARRRGRNGPAAERGAVHQHQSRPRREMFGRRILALPRVRRPVPRFARISFLQGASRRRRDDANQSVEDASGRGRGYRASAAVGRARMAASLGRTGPGSSRRDYVRGRRVVGAPRPRTSETRGTPRTRSRRRNSRRKSRGTPPRGK